jgi:ParB family chromosome partitioning protein
MNQGRSRSIESWPVRDIKVAAERRRTLKEPVVQRLMPSIARRGLLSPIRIRSDGELVFGLHRLVSHERLSLELIDVIVEDGDPWDAELDEIEENLLRREITVLERGQLELRQKALYLQRHPESRRGVAGATSRHLQAKSISFARAQADDKKGNRRMVEQRIQIAEQIGSEIAIILADARVADNHTQLLALARAPEQLRLAAAEHLVETNSTNVRAALAVVRGNGSSVTSPRARLARTGTGVLLESRGRLSGSTVVDGRTFRVSLDQDQRSFTVRCMGAVHAHPVVLAPIPVDRRPLTLAMTADISAQAIEELPTSLAAAVVLGPIMALDDGKRSRRLAQNLTVTGPKGSRQFQLHWIDATERLRNVLKGTVLFEVDRRSFLLGEEPPRAEDVRQALRDALVRALLAAQMARTELGRLYDAGGREWTFRRVAHVSTSDPGGSAPAQLGPSSEHDVRQLAGAGP